MMDIRLVHVVAGAPVLIPDTHRIISFERTTDGWVVLCADRRAVVR